MATTPNLGITELSTSQSNKETTINDALVALEAAITEPYAMDMSSADASLALADLQGAISIVISNPGASHTLTLPATKRLFVVHNSDDTNTVTVATGTTTVDIEPETLALLYMDGTTNGLWAVASGGGGADVPVTMGFFIGGIPGASELCGQYVAVEAFTIPSGFASSQAMAGTAATASAEFTVTKNGSSIGTFTFAAAGTTATFSLASDVSVAAGDYIGIVAPSSADSTLADISVTLYASR